MNNTTSDYAALFLRLALDGGRFAFTRPAAQS